MAQLGSTDIYGDLDVKNNNIKQVAKINNVTEDELGHLEGVSSNIQTQLNAKALSSTSITAGNGLTGGGTLAGTRTITLGTPTTVTNATTNSVTTTGHTHALTVAKADVGLSVVNNTSDASKPVSTAQQAALNLKADKSQVLTNVPSGAKFTDTIVDISGKADKTQVLTNVPSGAKFTDTITTVNGKTGAISKADILALGVGLTGAQGATGATGATGAKGDPFVYANFTALQLETLKVKGDKGDKGATGDRGIQGIQGIQGLKGATALLSHFL